VAKDDKQERWNVMSKVGLIPSS